MDRKCLKCGALNIEATGTATEACPGCDAIYSKVEAAQKLIEKHREAKASVAPASAATPVAAPRIIGADRIVTPQPPLPPRAAAPEIAKPGATKAIEKSFFGWKFWVFAVFCLLVWIGQGAAPGDRHGTGPVAYTNQAAPPPAPPQAIAISGTDMLMGYRENEVREDAKHRGVHVQTSGTIKTISKSIFGGLQMRLDVGDTKGDVLANLPDSQTANVSALDKGAQVTVDCEHFIFMFNDAVGHGCVIAR